MEIEVKAHLTNTTTVKKKLLALGCKFSDPKTQDDMVWAENTGSLDTFLANTVFLRIRVQNGKKVILTAKKPTEKIGPRSLVKHEHEIVVDSVDETRSILRMLKLKEAVRVIKTRQTTHYKGFEICIDDVDNLGSFIELERIGSSKEAKKIQEEMVQFLEMLGIPASNIVMKGYDILILEKQGAAS